MFKTLWNTNHWATLKNLEINFLSETLCMSRKENRLPMDTIELKNAGNKTSNEHVDSHLFTRGLSFSSRKIMYYLAFLFVSLLVVGVFWVFIPRKAEKTETEKMHLLLGHQRFTHLRHETPPSDMSKDGSWDVLYLRCNK